MNNVTLDRITSITSHSLPVQPDKFYNSNFSCGHLLAIACLSGSFYLVHKLKLDVLRRDDYTQLVRQSELPGNINEDSLRVCVSATFSPTGCALFTLDNMARISVIQVQPWRDAEVPLSQKEAAIGVLLSFAMLADVDSWDTRNLLNDLAKKDHEIVRRLDQSLQQALESDADFHQPYLASCQAQRILLLGRLERFQVCFAQLRTFSIFPFRLITLPHYRPFCRDPSSPSSPHYSARYAPIWTSYRPGKNCAILPSAAPSPISRVR